MATELRRILWRFQLGYFLKELIRDRFGDEISRLGESYRLLWDRIDGISGLGTSGDGLATRFEVTIKAAGQSLRQYDFVRTLHWFETAGEIFETMKLGAQAATQLTDLKNKMDTLNEQAGPQATIGRHFRDLESRCRALFNEGQFRAACALVRYCTREIESLITPGQVGEETKLLLQSRSRDQHTINSRVSQISPQSEEVLLAFDALAIVDRLFAEQRFALAERVLEEAEDCCAGVVAFLTAMDQKIVPDDISSSSMPELSGAGLGGRRGGSWQEATDSLLANRLQELSSHICDAMTGQNAKGDQARKASA
jgi:hypothetical protein